MKIKRWTLIVAVFSLFFACQSGGGEYVCPPCDLPCDELTFDKPGICPHCQMTLIHRSELHPEVNEINIRAGAGRFVVEGGAGRETKAITVHYYAPEGLSASTRVLWVIPGAGRNGDSYRDAWIDAAAEHDLLVLSPAYAEDAYSFEEYHLCGLIEGANLPEVIKYVEGTNQVQLDESLLTYDIVTDDSQWIFSDFDKIFELVIESTETGQESYDIFGHSAGGQILHRMTLLAPDTRADRIVAANSGFYTLPDTTIALPFGMKDHDVSQEQLTKAFGRELIVYLGELDNETENGGTLLRSQSADAQGLHRLARGQHFYEVARQTAEDLGVDFRWRLHVVPDVGHDYLKMGEVAADYLYEKKDN